ncbi:MAG: hypothetical protein ACTHOH_16265 [Lysobacteraceae bacterium]
MFSAGELIEALQSRRGRRFPLHADRPFGEFPPTWRTWLLSMQQRTGAIVGAPMSEIVALLAARPQSPPPRATPPLTRLQAWRHLLRQQWERAPRDQRRTRRFAAVFSALLHMVFAVLLLWIGMVQLGDAPPEAAQEGEATIIEFVGEGTPSPDTGGAPATGEQPAAAAAAAAPASAAATAESAATVAAATPPDAATPPEAASAPPGDTAPAPAVEQPLTVTQTPEPDSDFTLPPPTPPVLAPSVPQLQPQVPKVATQASEVETFEARTPVQALDRPVPALAVQPIVPRLRTQVVEVETQRETTPIVARTAPVLPTTAPQLRMPALRTAPRDVQLRAPPAPAPVPVATPAATAGSSTASTPARTTGPSPTPSPISGGTPRPSSGNARPAATAAAGVGPSPSPRPGAAPTQVRSDDWGASDRNVPGNATAGRSSGLLNGDGSARLPGNGRDVGGGLPPGTLIEDFEKIDRMGTWLKRPPLDYTPSRFDKFWMPRETLLEEWVRRGVRTVAIPIPGSSKRIMCTVSLLQAGGGCTIQDPNLQDQEAVARPPPDVPFKPALQEAKESLARPAQPATPVPAPAATPPGSTPGTP